MSDAPPRTIRTAVGIIGAGQLARMMGEVAHENKVEITVLASAPNDSAVATTDDSMFGGPKEELSLLALSSAVDVVTFDHELVDLALLEELEADDVIFRPSPAALRYAVDKGYQRQAFAAASLPVPRFLVVANANDDRIAAFLDEPDFLPVIKTARGGYDGRGVNFPNRREDALALIAELSTQSDVVLEERLVLKSEAAQLVARGVDGELVLYPLVDTLQQDGMCVEVRYPSMLDASLHTSADELSTRIAELVQHVGIMAVEYFVTDDGLLINEVALRPHNTGHWTIEGLATSQFAQHLLAVSGQPLGDVTPLAKTAAMVNVVGADQPGSLEAALGVEGVFVHDYGKTWRPGRKLGHVTAIGDDAHTVHVKAWEGARAYGTMNQEA